MVDGMRPLDGYAIETKHVRDPGCGKTYRSIDKVNRTLGTPPKLDAHGQPKFDPHRDGMYWQSMMAMDGVTGTARYVP